MSSDLTTDVELQPFVVWFMLSLCGLAVVLNIVAIVYIVKRGNFRASVDILLINLAVSDLLLAGLVHPLQFKNIFLKDGDFIGENAVCKLIMFVPKFIIMSAVFTMIAIAADRYRVVISQKQLERRGALTVIAIIWLSAVCFSAPQFYEYSVYDYVNLELNRTQTSCGSEGIIEHFETAYASVFLLTYFISVILINFWYGRIAYFVWRHARRFRYAQKQFPEDAAGNANGFSHLEQIVSKRKIKVLKMLISATLAFLLLWAPYFVLFAMKEILDLDHTNDYGKWPHLVSRTMTLSSTIINPLLLLAFSERVQHTVFLIVRCRWSAPRCSKQGSKISAELSKTLAERPQDLTNRKVC